MIFFPTKIRHFRERADCIHAFIYGNTTQPRLQPRWIQRIDIYNPIIINSPSAKHYAITLNDQCVVRQTFLSNIPNAGRHGDLSYHGTIIKRIIRYIFNTIRQHYRRGVIISSIKGILSHSFQRTGQHDGHTNVVTILERALPYRIQSHAKHQCVNTCSVKCTLRYILHRTGNNNLAPKTIIPEEKILRNYLDRIAYVQSAISITGKTDISRIVKVAQVFGMTISGIIGYPLQIIGQYKRILCHINQFRPDIQLFHGWTIIKRCTTNIQQAIGQKDIFQRVAMLERI